MHPTVQMQVGDDVQIDIELPMEEPPGGYTLAASEAGVTRVISSKRLEEALDRIKPIANALFHRLNSIDVTPDEVEVKFGVKLTAEAGVIISATAAEANFEFKLKWTPPKGAKKVTG